MWDRSSTFSKEDVRSSFLRLKEQVGSDKTSFVLSSTFCLPLFACLSSPPPPTSLPFPSLSPLPPLSLSLSSSLLFLPLSVGCVRGVLASAAERLGLMCGCCMMTEGFTNMSHPSGRLVKLVQKGVRKDRIAELWVLKFGARLIWTSLKYEAVFVRSALHGCSQMQRTKMWVSMDVASQQCLCWDFWHSKTDFYPEVFIY